MRNPLGVIADDFTGACDVAVQFRKHGLETVVLADVDSLARLSGAFDVIVVNTETRNLTAKQAYKKVRRAVRLLQERNIRLIYKKIDSTLRGNLGAEIKAVMDELKVKAVIVAPAFPSQKRTLIQGRLLINGVPLKETEYAEDPLSPLGSSRLSTLLRDQTGEEVGEIHLSIVWKGSAQIEKEIREYARRGTKIIAVDAELQSDLTRIAEAAIVTKSLLCGSAGLASALPLQMFPQPRILVVSGSVNTVTLHQIETAERRLKAEVIEPNLRDVLKNEEAIRKASEVLVKEAEAAFSKGKAVVIRLASSKSVIRQIQEAGKRLGMDRREVSDVILSVLSMSVKKILERQSLGCLVLIGGETSIRVINDLRALGVRVERELLPGIPWGRIIGGEHDGLRVITKAGGFGDDGTLVEIIKYAENLLRASSKNQN
jgi:uncharacterized protein YgbK (DUF1537 family)